MGQSVKHLGIIMDGNRRWAKAKGQSAAFGHKAGFSALKDLLSCIKTMDIEYVSVYAFSTENWKRSESEVGALMSLIRWVFKNELESFNKQDIRLMVAGSRDKLAKDIVKLIEHAEGATAANQSGTLVICLNYGGHEEIISATKKMIIAGVDPNDVSIETFAANLYTPSIPNIDLIIRTSGEQRLSNFMLWRAAYAEFVFTQTLWPDFTEEELKKIIQEYESRQRRFGE